MIKNKIITGLLCCSICFSNTVYAVTDTPTIETVKASCMEALANEDAVSGTLTGTIDLEFGTKKNMVPLKWDIEARSEMKPKPFELYIASDITKIESDMMGGLSSFEIYIVPDENGSDKKLLYFGSETDDNKNKTEWKRVDIDDKIINKAFGIQDGISVMVIPNDLSMFVLDSQKRMVDGENCYVLHADLSSDAILDWYNSKKSSDASASAATGSASAAAATVAATLNVKPNYDELFRNALELIDIKMELDISEKTNLPKRLYITLEGDMEELAKVIAPQNAKNVNLKLNYASLEYLYEFGDVEVDLPEEATNNAVVLENKKETRPVVNTSNVSTSNANTETGAVAAAAAAASSAIASPVVNTPAVVSLIPQVGSQQVFENEGDANIDYGFEEGDT